MAACQLKGLLFIQVSRVPAASGLTARKISRKFGEVEHPAVIGIGVAYFRIPIVVGVQLV